MAQPHKVQPEESVDAWLERQPLPGLVAALRARILDAEPSLREAVKWSLPWYVGRHNVFYLTCSSAYATLGVCAGAHLDDPDDLLEGTGKGMRHVKLHSLEDLARPALGALIDRALAYDRTAVDP